MRKKRLNLSGLIKRFMNKNSGTQESIIKSIKDNTIEDESIGSIDVDYMMRIFREDIICSGKGRWFNGKSYFFLDGGCGTNTIIDLNHTDSVYKVSGNHIYEIEMPIKINYSSRIDAYNILVGGSHRRNAGNGNILNDSRRNNLIQGLKNDAPEVYMHLVSQYPLVFDDKMRE